MNIGMAAGAAVLMGVFVAGQTASASKSDDVLPALLVEVKGLRAAMEQMASTGPRVQLLVSRLQLQEARMNGMIRRLDGVRDSLASEQRELTQSLEAQQRFEASLASGPTSPGQREELAQFIDHAKREVATHRSTATRLSGEEAQLAQDLAAEQARWADISQRLDELERTLNSLNKR